MQTNKHPALTEAEAKAKGFWRLTNPYLANETRFMERAIRQLGGIAYCLVETELGPTIWRSGRRLEVEGEE